MAGQYGREYHEEGERGREWRDVPEDAVHGGKLVGEGARTEVVQCAERRRQGWRGVARGKSKEAEGGKNGPQADDRKNRGPKNYREPGRCVIGLVHLD